MNSKRIAFKHEGFSALILSHDWSDRTIYEWDQTLDEVNIYIKPPQGVRAKDIFCEITAQHIKLGLKGNPPFLSVRKWFYGIFDLLQHDLTNICKVKESVWLIGKPSLLVLCFSTSRGWRTSHFLAKRAERRAMGECICWAWTASTIGCWRNKKEFVIGAIPTRSMLSCCLYTHIFI